MLTFASVKRGGVRARQGTPQSAPHPIARETRLQIRRILQTPQIQPKLTVGPSDDEFEQEADRVADEVMRMPDPAAASGAPEPPRIQRKCKEYEEEETNLRRSPAGGAGAAGMPDVTPELVSGIRSLRGGGRPLPESTRAFFELRASSSTGSDDGEEVSTDFASGIRSLQGGGQPLPDSTREFFERRFGRALGSVRIHDHAHAADMAQSVNARAFTVASDVVFACGSYAPDSAEGRRLLAHELVHTVQQAGGTGRDWSGAGVVQRQFVTPLAAGGGFHGLMERDRRAAYGPAPLMFSYNANLDPELRERFNRMAFEMHRRGIGYTSIADVRTPQIAHIVSTGHHIRERKAIPLKDLRELTD